MAGKTFKTANWVLVAVLVALPGLGQSETLCGRALIDALRDGGFNLYFRHAATEWSQSDHVNERGDWTSCDPTRMRQLSAAGRETSESVGAALQEFQIPVGSVHASPYCRTVETATLLDLGPVETSTDVMNLRAGAYFGGREAIVARARARLRTPPAAETNVVFVAHGNVARAATQVYPAEGEMLVFRPGQAGELDFVGRMAPDAWRDPDGSCR